MSITVEIPSPCDFHVHLRNGFMLEHVAKFSDEQFGLVLIMPNTNPPLDTPVRLHDYRREVALHLKKARPLYTFKLTAETKPEEVIFFKRSGAVAAKLYPDSVTTNSDTGLTKEFFTGPLSERFSQVLQALADAKILLLLHGEMPGSPDRTAEADFLGWVRYILTQFPTLRVVLEHISSAAAVTLIQENADFGWRLGATVTLHHLLKNATETKDDPFSRCKPIIKEPNDQEALIALVMSGHPNVFFGTDSAPHALSTKINLKPGQKPSNGIFSAPVAMPGIIHFLAHHNCLHLAANFLTYNGCRFYNVEPPPGFMVLAQGDNQIPVQTPCNPLPPWFLEGVHLDWRIKAFYR